MTSEQGVFFFSGSPFMCSSHSYPVLQWTEHGSCFSVRASCGLKSAYLLQRRSCEQSAHAPVHALWLLVSKCLVSTRGLIGIPGWDRILLTPSSHVKSWQTITDSKTRSAGCRAAGGPWLRCGPNLCCLVAGARVNAKDNMWLTPLHRAVASRSEVSDLPV